MIKKFKYDYDFENDSLFLYDDKLKSKASIEIDDLIIDYSSNKEISAIELINASKFFKDLSFETHKLDKNQLNDIKECKIEIIPKNNFLILKIMFLFNTNIELCAPIFIPTIHESSPAII